MTTQKILPFEQHMSKSNRRKYLLERVSKKVFLGCALLSVVSLLLIVGFVLMKGTNPFLSGDYQILDFLFR